MSDLSLYNITNGFAQLMNEDEITEENKEQIQKELYSLLEKKSQSIIGYARNLELTINAMKEEENRIATTRKGLENKLSNFKQYVKTCMEQGSFEKIDTCLGSISIAKSPISVEIVNQEAIPDEYKKTTTTITLDKRAILEHFKETGEILAGTNIVTDSTYLKIK